MSDVHNLGDFAFAKQMLEEIPKALATLEHCQDSLYPFRAFNNIADSMITIQSAIINLETRLPFFQKIVDEKGEQ